MRNAAQNKEKLSSAEKELEKAVPVKGEVLPAEETSPEAAEAENRKEQKPKKKRFIDKFLPKSQEGRIIFANSVAQVASIFVAPLIVLGLEGLAKSQLNAVTRKMGGVFGKHMHRIEPVISRPWKSSLSEQSLQRWERGSSQFKGNYLASVVTNLGLQTVSNVSVTLACRLVLDKVFDTKMGARSIIASQALDTAVVLGGMVALPTLLPKPTRNARENLQSYLQEKQDNGHGGWRALLGKNPNAPRQFALNSVNFTIPDLAGFSVGTAAMLYNARKQKEREQAESNIIQR